MLEAASTEGRGSFTVNQQLELYPPKSSLPCRQGPHVEIKKKSVLQARCELTIPIPIILVTCALLLQHRAANQNTNHKTRIVNNKTKF